MKQDNQRLTRPPSPLPEHHIRSDFADYGFTSHESQALFTFQEPIVDSYAQISHGRFATEKRKAERVLRGFHLRKDRRNEKESKNGGTYGVRGGSKRQQVYLDAEKKWVLFDPIRGWPPTMESKPPLIYEKYERYEKGNRKVVIYNRESYAVSLRSVPEILKGFQVAYQKAGPKLVKVKECKKK